MAQARYSRIGTLVGAEPSGRRMPFAFLLSVLEGSGIMRVVFDSTLQTVLMLAFFTTIGMMASLKLIGQGGKLLLGFLVSVTVLAVL